MPNVIYIAPGGKQMKLVAGTDGLHRKIKITDDPPENSCKPSVDYLFRSIGDYYVGRTTAVIMTGMGSDGTRGLGLPFTVGCQHLHTPKDFEGLGLQPLIAHLRIDVSSFLSVRKLRSYGYFSHLSSHNTLQHTMRWC